MAQTIPNITVTNEWQSINSLSGIAIGTAIYIQNKSPLDMYIAEGTQPSSNSTDGAVLTPLREIDSAVSILAGSLEIWVRLTTNRENTTGIVNVQAS